MDFYDFLQPLPEDELAVGDVYERARRNGARQGTPLFVSPSGVADARVNLFFRTGVMASRRPATWRRYAYSLVVWLDFLETRGRSWDEATARDVEEFKDWRLTDERNPHRVSPAAFDVDRAAMNALYTWANGWYGVANPVPTVGTGHGQGMTHASGQEGTRRRRDPLRPAGAARRQVKWMLRPAYEQWRDIGLRGYGFDGQRREGWRGFTEDRDVAFTDGLYGTGLRVAEWASILDIELPGAEATGRYPRAWLAAACIKGGREGRSYRIPRTVLDAIDSYIDPVEGSRAETIARARRRGTYTRVAGIQIVISYQRATRTFELEGRDGPVKAPLDAIGPPERLRLFRRTEHGLEPLMLWLADDGLPKHAHGWQDTFRDANARIVREWARAGGAPGEARLWCRPHMLRHSFALKWFSILSVVWHQRLAGFTAEEQKDLRDQLGDVWFQLATLLGHADPATTRDYYLEPFTGLQVDYLLSLLDDTEQAAIDQLVRAAGASSGRTLAAAVAPTARAIAVHLDSAGTDGPGR